MITPVPISAATKRLVKVHIPVERLVAGGFPHGASNEPIRIL